MPKARCERVRDFDPTRTFLQSDRVVYLRALAAYPATMDATARCVDVELQVTEELRGEGYLGKRIRLIARQEMTTEPPRPSSAWWVMTEPIVTGGVYTAFCPAGELQTTLRGACVIVSGTHHFGTSFARDAESGGLTFSETIAKLRATCPEADDRAIDYVMEKYLQHYDPVITSALVALMTDPECKHVRQHLRERLRSNLDVWPAEFAHDLIRSLFAQIDPARWETHELLGLILDAVGLRGSGPKRSAAEIFGSDSRAREAAVEVISRYQGKVDTSDLWIWIHATR